jgi:hypothetical protein
LSFAIAVVFHQSSEESKKAKTYYFILPKWLPNDLCLKKTQTKQNLKLKCYAGRRGLCL